MGGEGRCLQVKLTESWASRYEHEREVTRQGRVAGSGIKCLSTKKVNLLNDEDQPMRRRGEPLDPNLDAMNGEHEEKGCPPDGRKSEEHMNLTHTRSTQMNRPRNMRG